MSQNGSDIAFKSDEKVIPAHKQVLVKRSRYFEGLFNSGMAESKQDVIEIKDCEYEIFKELLRWLYQATVNLNDANQAIKLHTLADKYLQEDLCKKCLNFLTSIPNMENVYTILDFAHQENVSQIKVWCTKLFQDKLTIHNVAELIKYLVDRQEDLESKENNRKFRNQALNFVLDNFFEIHENEKGNIQLYEDFLLKNIEIDTIPPLADFLGQEQKKYREEIFEKSTIHLKEAVFSFIEENARIVMTSPEAKDFPHGFLRELFLYTAENKPLKSENRKRMEPSQNGLDGEGHELKKTKE